MKAGSRPAPLIFGAIVLALLMFFLILIAFWMQVLPGPYLTGAPGP